MSVVDLRLGKKDGDDHLFIRIGDEWRGDLRIGLIIGHVSIMTPSSHLEIHLFISLFLTSFNGASPDYITYIYNYFSTFHGKFCGLTEKKTWKANWWHCFFMILSIT